MNEKEIYKLWIEACKESYAHNKIRLEIFGIQVREVRHPNGTILRLRNSNLDWYPAGADKAEAPTVSFRFENNRELLEAIFDNIEKK